VNEGEELVQFNAKIPRALRSDVKAHCAQRDVHIYDFTREALREKLARDGLATRAVSRGKLVPLSGRARAKRRKS
jgi:hypothetical protein